MGACHCTSDGQEHKIIWHAGPERERIFHLRVTACREQGSHCRHERLALGSFTVRWQGTSCSSSFVSKVLGANYNRANNFHPVADKFAMCTNGGQEVTFEPTSNAHARVDYNTCCIIDLITIKPNPAAFYFRHGRYRSHCNHCNVYSQVCHHV